MIRGISSMATRQLLEQLARDYQSRSGIETTFESVGGVEAAKRVRAGETFDLAVLASDVIDGLIAEGHLLAGSRTDLVRSGIAIAVRAGMPHPAIGSEEALRASVLAADSIGYSTGPSGTALMQLFERWGIAGDLQSRLVQARPGFPVGQLVAQGQAQLGFQQLSELINLPGIEIIGPMPEAIQIITTFSAGICAASTQADALHALLAFLAGPDSAQAKQRQGMEPA
jgi:molybdate transport system substrate-binding protein